MSVRRSLAAGGVPQQAAVTCLIRAGCGVGGVGGARPLGQTQPRSTVPSSRNRSPVCHATRRTQHVRHETSTQHVALYASARRAPGGSNEWHAPSRLTMAAVAAVLVCTSARRHRAAQRGRRACLRSPRGARAARAATGRSHCVAHLCRRIRESPPEKPSSIRQRFVRSDCVRESPR
jgi:hypothetical protein